MHSAGEPFSARSQLARKLLAGTALAPVVMFGLGTPARAVDYIWGGTGSSTITTSYNLGTNWSNPPAGAPPVSAGKSAIFGANGSANVTVAPGITPDSWTFTANSQSYAISGNAVNFNGAGPNLVNNANAGQTIAISDNMTGAGILQAGASTLTLSGTTSFTTTSITAGTLVNAGSLTTTVANSATFTNNSTVTGDVTNSGTFGNTGTLTGSLSQSAGSTTNSGTITGTLGVTGGTFTNSAGGQVQGTTTNNGGALTNNGSFAGNVNVLAGSLNGVGTIAGALNIASGATLASGNGTPGSSMTVGSLALPSGAIYIVQVNPATSSFTSVTGTATLGGATVNATFANGSYVVRQYTIVAAGSVSGTFNPTVTNNNLPSGFRTTLSYDATHAYLNLALGFTPPSGQLNGNQQAVGNTIVNYFNTNGGIPIVFGGLTPAGLTQLSGEGATATQQATFNAMNQFMGVMTDPFVSGRGDPASAGGGAAGYADEARSYAGKRRPNDALAAIYAKAPPIVPLQQRWSVWAAGFGGSQRTDGNAALGSNDTRSSIYGTAVGLDYRLSPDTLAGFALAGGGTNFTVNGLGTGRSDLFQAGAFLRHNAGPAYLVGALAYGWQDVTTDRTVTIAGVDQLRAKFNADAWSGRLEGGYRFVMQGFGLTPYAAGQFTTFELPAYAEQVVSGANTFALAYGATTVTATRSELGLRSDKSIAMQDGVFTLRGRLAWAHDYNADRNVGATFQTLPGASFVVNGARPAPDAALTTASAEWKWLNGWSAAAAFEGEFSNVTRSYAGKGLVRYAW